MTAVPVTVEPDEIVAGPRIQWAEKISASWRDTVRGILATGNALVGAKADPDMAGQFMKMVKEDLPFSVSMAERLMAIARKENATQQISAHAPILPTHWYTVYQITQLTDAQFQRGIETRIINPEMERSDIDRLTGKRTATQQSNTNEWWTPADYLDAARTVMGGIDLDPASCEDANQTVRATEFFDGEADGLDQIWFGRVWLNPPYGKLAGSFVAKLVDEESKGNIEQAIVLVNANTTDTKWFAPLWDRILCFTNHRIDFNSPNYKHASSTHGSVFIYFGPDEKSFAKHFDEFGFVVRRFDHGN